MQATINEWTHRRLRWIRSAPAFGLAALLMACSGSTRNQATLSGADVLVPEAPFSESYAFTVYDGWQNVYQLLYNSAIGSEEFVQAVEFTPNGEWGTNAFGEGLSQDEINVIERARDDAASGDSGACQIATSAPEVQLCVYPGYSFLVRGFPTGESTTWIVADYHDNPAAARGTADPAVYNPDSIEARFMAADFQPVAVSDAIEEYLVDR